MRDIERERDRILERDGWHDIERGQDPRMMLPGGRGGHLVSERRDEYEASAEYYRLAAAWTSRLRGQRRAIWTAHAAGSSCTVIARRVRVYRRRVWETIAEEREAMLAQLLRPRGRRPRPEGMHRGTRVLSVRLLDSEAEALAALAARLGVTEREALRAALRMACSRDA